MKILFIAPLPPPVTGQSLACKVLFDEIIKKNTVELINLSKSGFKQGISSINRIIEVLAIVLNVWRKKNSADLIYLTIAESIAGNIKDILIYMICFRRLDAMIIQMLGGAGMKSILEQKGILYKLNKFFISRMRSVIVEGKMQAATFSELICTDKIYIVPNFAEDFLFLNEDEIRNKFTKIYPLKILFLSNLLFGKGHNELVDAYLSLNDEIKEKVKVVFVGGFESAAHKSEFLNKIHGHSGLTYYGNYVGGEEKKALYRDSHIFSLPTYYPYEGQPISILEAYATGCVVITTEHSGIPDVFCDIVNGYAVDKKSVNSIKLVIEHILKNTDRLLDVAILNRNTAYEKYRTTIYTSSIVNIIDNSGLLNLN